MSDMHVMSGTADGSWVVVMHFLVPNINNSVTVNYRTAVVNSGLGGTTILTEGVGPGQITTAEKAQVDSGELYEHSTVFRAESTTNLQNAIRLFYTAEKTSVLAELQRKLRYFGHIESEV